MDHGSHGHHHHAPPTVMPSTTVPPMMDHSAHIHAGHAGHEGHGMSMDNSSCPDMNMGHSMMSMAFHFGHCETVLFDAWRITSVGSLIGSMFGIFVIAALYEGLKYYREYLFWRSNNSIQYRSVAPPEKGSTPNDDTNARVVTMIPEIIHHQPKKDVYVQWHLLLLSTMLPCALVTFFCYHNDMCPTMLSSVHVLQTTLHLIQIAISYMLMLIFMTYNVWLCLAVISGAGVGYFLFGWKKSVIVDVTEHCH